MSPLGQPQAPSEARALLPGHDAPVLDLERLLDARLCRRLPWWRAQGLAQAQEPPLWREMPRPWPALPPGWRRPGRGWSLRVLDLAEPCHLQGLVHWLVEDVGRPHLVLLGEQGALLRQRGRLLAAILRGRGNPWPTLWRQGFPPGGCTGTWLGDWPDVRPMPVPTLGEAELERTLAGLLLDLSRDWPPPRTAPRARCWDCPAGALCADHA